jgi:magnesium chelatase family protein
MYSGSARDFVTVGMPDTAVRESRERIKSALLNSGFGYPNKAVTINLAPANVRKEGVGFDLPMAIGILGAMGMAKCADQHLLVGECRWMERCDPSAEYCPSQPAPNGAASRM